jgi:hypothetical protein
MARRLSEILGQCRREKKREEERRRIKNIQA